LPGPRFDATLRPVNASEKQRARDLLKSMSKKERTAVHDCALAMRDEDRARRARTRRRRTDDAPPSLRDYELRVAAAMLSDAQHTSTRRAVVVEIWAGGCRVRCDGELLDARMVSRIAEVQRTALAVGDEVRLADADHDVVVVEVLERRSSLSRPDPMQPSIERVLVANLDRIVLVVTAVDPPFRPRLIDRYLIAAKRGNVAMTVCVNKVDTAGDALDACRGILESYRAVDIEVLEVSALTGQGVETLRNRLRDATFAFVGQSGVGKSSLANALSPALALRVGATSDAVGKGRHTTTSASLHALEDGMTLIDTPGIRSFGLVEMSPADVRDAFTEFTERAGQCRFADCVHRDEPDCAVKAAVEAGAIPELRYLAYARLVDEATAAIAAEHT
jgi:ribosome biogenesis GTPase / thiamine phosphate phosphatase